MSPLSINELLGLPLGKPEAPRLVSNRADRRRWLQPAKNPRRSAAGRRVARPRCQHGTPLPFPWSVPTVYCQVCAAEATALLAKQAAEAAEMAEEIAPRRRRIRAASTQAGERWRLRWWIGRHPENAAYLLIVCLVAAFLALAVVRGGWS